MNPYALDDRIIDKKCYQFIEPKNDLELEEMAKELTFLLNVSMNNVISVQKESYMEGIVVPEDMEGINKKQFKVYLEESLYLKIKRVVKRILSFIFEGSVSAIEFMENEVDYLEVNKKLLLLKRHNLKSEESSIDKSKFDRIMLSVWSYKTTDTQLTGLKDIFLELEKILSKQSLTMHDFRPTPKFTEALKDLGHTIDAQTNKIHAIPEAAETATKKTMHDHGWSFSKVSDTLNTLITVLENKRVLGRLISKLETINQTAKKELKKLDNVAPDVNAVPVVITDLKKEYVFINDLKSVAVKHLHTITHQTLQMVNNLLATAKK